MWPTGLPAATKCPGSRLMLDQSVPRGLTMTNSGEMTDARAHQRPPLPASGAWRPGDPVGRRQFFAPAASTARSRSRAAALSTRSSSPTRHGARSTTTRQRHPRVPRLDGRQPRRRARSVRATPRPGWWDGHGRPRAAHRHRPLVRGVRQRARRVPGIDRPGVDRAGRPAGPTARASRSSRSATWSAPRPRWPTISGSRSGSASSAVRWAGCRCSSGGSCIPSGCGRCCRSPRARRPPPSRSRWAASGRRAIALDPRWRGGDYYDAAPGRGPHAGLALARKVAQITFRSDDVFTDRFGREMADVAGRASRCGSASRSSATSTTTATSSSAASTRTRIWSSARRWTCTTSAAAAAGRRRRWSASVCPSLTIGIRSDMLYPTYQQKQIRDVLRRTGGRADTWRSTAPHGHDAFLIDLDQVGAAVAGFLDDVKKEHGPAMTSPTNPTNPIDAPARHDRDPRRARRQRHIARSCAVGDERVRHAEARRGPAHVDGAVGPSASTPDTRNPTVKSFEDAVAALEGAEAALRVLARGWARSPRRSWRCARPGDHIVAQRHIYSGTQLFLQGACPRFGIDVTFVDGTEPGAFAAAVIPGRTMLVVTETPGESAAGAGRPR